MTHDIIKYCKDNLVLICVIVVLLILFIVVYYLVKRLLNKHIRKTDGGYCGIFRFNVDKFKYDGQPLTLNNNIQCKISYDINNLLTIHHKQLYSNSELHKLFTYQCTQNKNFCLCVNNHISEFIVNDNNIIINIDRITVCNIDKSDRKVNYDIRINTTDLSFISRVYKVSNDEYQITYRFASILNEYILKINKNLTIIQSDDLNIYINETNIGARLKITFPNHDYTYLVYGNLMYEIPSGLIYKFSIKEALGMNFVIPMLIPNSNIEKLFLDKSNGKTYIDDYSLAYSIMFQEEEIYKLIANPAQYIFDETNETNETAYNTLFAYNAARSVNINNKYLTVFDFENELRHAYINNNPITNDQINDVLESISKLYNFLGNDENLDAATFICQLSNIGINELSNGHNSLLVDVGNTSDKNSFVSDSELYSIVNDNIETMMGTFNQSTNSELLQHVCKEIKNRCKYISTNINNAIDNITITTNVNNIFADNSITEIINKTIREYLSETYNIENAVYTKCIPYITNIKNHYIKISKYFNFILNFIEFEFDYVDELEHAILNNIINISNIMKKLLFSKYEEIVNKQILLNNSSLQDIANILRQIYTNKNELSLIDNQLNKTKKEIKLYNDKYTRCSENADKNKEKKERSKRPNSNKIKDLENKYEKWLEKAAQFQEHELKLTHEKTVLEQEKTKILGCIDTLTRTVKQYDDGLDVTNRILLSYITFMRGGQCRLDQEYDNFIDYFKKKYELLGINDNDNAGNNAYTTAIINTITSIDNNIDDEQIIDILDKQYTNEYDYGNTENKHLIICTMLINHLIEKVLPESIRVIEDSISSISKMINVPNNNIYTQIMTLVFKYDTFKRDLLKPHNQKPNKQISPAIPSNDCKYLYTTEIGSTITSPFINVIFKYLTDNIRSWYLPDGNDFKQIVKPYTIFDDGIQIKKDTNKKYNIADIYPAQKVIMFILYVCLYAGHINNIKHEKFIQLYTNKDLFKMLAAYMLYVFMFNTYCACYMEESWNKSIHNECIYGIRDKDACSGTFVIYDRSESINNIISVSQYTNVKRSLFIPNYLITIVDKTTDILYNSLSGYISLTGNENPVFYTCYCDCDISKNKVDELNDVYAFTYYDLEECEDIDNNDALREYLSTILTDDNTNEFVNIENVIMCQQTLQIQCDLTITDELCEIKNVNVISNNKHILIKIHNKNNMTTLESVMNKLPTDTKPKNDINSSVKSALHTFISNFKFTDKVFIFDDLEKYIPQIYVDIEGKINYNNIAYKYVTCYGSVKYNNITPNNMRIFLKNNGRAILFKDQMHTDGGDTPFNTDYAKSTCILSMAKSIQNSKCRTKTCKMLYYDLDDSSKKQFISDMFNDTASREMMQSYVVKQQNEHNKHNTENRFIINDFLSKKLSWYEYVRQQLCTEYKYYIGKKITAKYINILIEAEIEYNVNITHLFTVKDLHDPNYVYTICKSLNTKEIISALRNAFERLIKQINDVLYNSSNNDDSK